MNILSKKMYPAGAGNNLIPGDSMGDSRLWDAINRYRSNDLNSFSSEKYQIQSANGAGDDAKRYSQWHHLRAGTLRASPRNPAYHFRQIVRMNQAA